MPRSRTPSGRSGRSPRTPGLRDRLRPFVGDHPPRPARPPAGGAARRPGRGRDAVARHGRRALHAALAGRGGRAVRARTIGVRPGPASDSRTRTDWKPLKSSDQLLDLKVADIACGSGAFLVAAARYLAARLVEAWHREGVATGTPHELYVQAVRQVVANCLYGADINAMAVEMCKLSLWLVSLDPKLPFSFVDDKVLHGNSLLGLTDKRQLQVPAHRPLIQTRQPRCAAQRHRRRWRARAGRRTCAGTSRAKSTTPTHSVPSPPSDGSGAEYQELTEQLTNVADGVVAAGLRLGGKPGKALNQAYENLQIAVGRGLSRRDAEPNRTMLDAILDTGLTPTVSTDYDRWKPLHWILAVPDVMERGGFDAVIGNPPFLGGQKLTGSLGTNVRDWFVNVLAGGQKGSADLVAYFFLRATSLLDESGQSWA